MTLSEEIRNWVLSPVIIKINEMEKKIMAQIDDLNTEVAAVKTAVGQLGTDLTAAIAKLEAEIAAAGTAVDLTGPIADLKAVADSLTALDTTTKSV